MDGYITTLAYVLITLVNVYWTWQARKLQNRDDTIKWLKAQLELKDKAISDMLRKKNQIKHQYENLLADYKQLQGENTTYKNFHGHPKV